MARRDKTARRLVVDGKTFLWSLSHHHRALGNGRYEGCCEILVIRLFRARGRLRISFEEGPGRLVPDGYLMHSGAVGTTEGGFLNLHEPGTARALLDVAVTKGWCPDDPATAEMDGWSLFDAVATRRGALPPA
ncbi:hypothetical protein TPA0598_03_07060 [Streptomyces lydicamycinicus]|uniref:Uncharacterized protein n=1 Tax=Streptomyces lydicamycinicus TaxID=1546107 RepID=A0A0P4R718_9ACTN|nr:hypothetical protein [Streptomyces lydicamycinicus]GAO08245.1 hypothetical protein TPA0598_03_07060 [Streptomyces lydicamycinicus]